MADSNYLSPELKNYYLLDFEQVLVIDDSFWGIQNDFLKSCLQKINTSNSIQTLYSRIKKIDISDDEESYLVLGFTKDIKENLQRNLEKFVGTFKNCNAITLDLMPPSKNLNTGPEELKSGAIHNKEYFNIHHFRITCLSNKYEVHEQFWTQITLLLVNI